MMNTARSKVESMLQDEHGRNKNLQHVLDLKDDVLDGRMKEIEELD